ncbi:hypothetical protein LU298_02165 [Komagataeibacter intermedius]|uniref:Uncharacterized protein n=2 Tax=Komagataeibacter intermedius TaxID=66229 RepID=A0A0N0MH91_9PROT|nr:hypothetical protein [Komagataeibacter intermedius]KPH88834.1 hypothetical protein GLUCOINTEAF2_0201378 [Komagataeibacter intermedius AF2]MCF3635313.1 hypothetical protein [Komagataeibacter intermedius]GAN87496.1 hypothetical protein Gain_0064_039 [Komagataeibacter intermedius TF2]GBQ67664.1 hypothetical protein AA0521_1047 [Komagataeibacter intermedius NRIC 0521]
MTDQTPPDAFEQGKAAAARGEPLIENPFDETLPACEQWNRGWWSVRENDGDFDPFAEKQT